MKPKVRGEGAGSLSMHGLLILLPNLFIMDKVKHIKKSRDDRLFTQPLPSIFDHADFLPSFFLDIVQKTHTLYFNVNISLFIVDNPL
jgi:hypothetical protein